MKKLITITTSALLIAAMSLTVFAESGSKTIQENNGTKDITVNAKYVDATTTEPVISVDVEWGDMEFTYTVGGEKEWNAKSHEYTIKNPTAVWTANGNEINVTNHSNVDVNTNFTYTAGTDNTLTGSFTYSEGKTVNNDTVKLTKGVVNEPDTADKVTATLTLSGTPSDTYSTFTDVGSVTVKITKA